MIKLNFKDFITKIIIRIIIISLITFALPMLIYYNYEEGWYRLILLSIFSCSVTIATILFIGMDKQERIFIYNIFKNKILSAKTMIYYFSALILALLS